MEYEILGISPNSTDEEIRKAYLKLARKYHPDRNNSEDAEKQFKKINNAYENICKKNTTNKPFLFSFTNNISPEFKNLAEKIFTSDKCNSFYEKISKINNIFNKTSSEDIMSEIYNYSKFYNEKHYDTKDTPPLKLEKYDDIIYNVNITLEDIYNKTIKKINVKRMYKCRLCHAIGYTIDDTKKKHLCTQCNGVLYLPNFKDFSFSSNQEQVIFENDGNEQIDFLPGDIVINILPKKNHNYSIDNKNIILEKKISLYEIYNGIQFNFIYLDKQNYTINYNKPLLNSLEKVVKGKGLPDKEGIYNDLIIKFNVIFPKINSDKLHLFNGLSINDIENIDTIIGIEEISLD